MAPKKNENSLKLEKRVGKVAAMKTRNKSPNLIKLAIPLPNSPGRKVARKNPLGIQEQIMISNEVAKVQLMRGVNKIIVDEPQVLTRTRTRKKAPVIVSEFFSNTEEPNKTMEVKKEKLTKEIKNKISNEPKKTNGASRKKKPTKTVTVEKEPKEIAKRKRPIKTKTVGVETRNLRSKKPHIQESNETSEVKLEENSDLVKNRRLSATSFSNLSWTKDISSSSASTMLAVSSNDFVCIDNKVPNINLQSQSTEINADKLNSNGSQIVDGQVNTNESKDEVNDDTSSSSSSTSSSSSSRTRYSSNIDVQSLNLSKSTDDNPHKYVLKTINDLLTQIDLTNIDWKCSAETFELDFEVQQKIKNELDFERNIKTCCRQLIRILDDSDDPHLEDDKKLTKDEEVNWQAKSKICENNKEVNKFAIFKSIDTKNVNREQIDTVEKSACENNKNVLYDSYDDDAVSLDTESITGIESSRTSVHEPISNQNDDEIERETCSPYVPQPLTEVTPCTSRYDYRPTKIDTESTKKIVCEKQNADSTSINKDPDIPVSISDNESMSNTNTVAPRVSKPVNDRPQFIAPMLKSSGGVKSILFKDVCFFNVINNCNNKECRYPHIIPDSLYVIRKLTSYSNELFINEYLAIRNWLVLKQNYGMQFVNECKRRKLTRLLLEMAIDFSKNTSIVAVEEALQVEVVESVLLYLNSLDLMASKLELDDLFMHKINNKTRLCDLFIQNIADTQNFSRFKSVFLFLTYFIVRNGGSFLLCVAEHLLERICILPSEPSLYYALYDIITHTDVNIFKNKMMSLFENNLRNIDLERFEKLVEFKNESYLKQRVSNVPFGYVTKEPIYQDTDCNNLYKDKERYTSPDTTNGETNTQILPVIKRTIAFNPKPICTSPNSDERPTKTPQKWRTNRFQQTFNFPRPSRPALNSLMDSRPMFRSRPPLGAQRFLRPMMPQRQVTYRQTQPKCMIMRPRLNYE